MAAQEIVAGPHREPHQPVFERSFAAKTLQLLIGFEPHLLDDVLDLTFAPGITAGSSKDAGRIFLDQRLEAGGVAFQHRRYEFRFGPFHRLRTMPDGQRRPKGVFLAEGVKSSKRPSSREAPSSRSDSRRP